MTYRNKRLRCQHCGNEFERIGKTGLAPKTCSPKCYYRAYAEKNRERISARARRANATPERKEYMRSYSEKNREALNEKARARNAANREAERARGARYRERNRERWLGLKRARYAKDPEKSRENALRYSTNRRKAGIGQIPAGTVSRLMAEQGGRCAYCGCEIPPYHVDHKMPVARGGTNAPDNLHLTCPRCNLRKGSMTHEEFLVSKRRRVRAIEKGVLR